MSDERFEQEELQDEDVEAHKKHSMARNTAASDELGTDSDDEDVEAHKKHSMARNTAAPNESDSDDSDDVEAHRKHC